MTLASRYNTKMSRIKRTEELIDLLKEFMTEDRIEEFFIPTVLLEDRPLRIQVLRAVRRAMNVEFQLANYLAGHIEHLAEIELLPAPLSIGQVITGEKLAKYADNFPESIFSYVDDEGKTNLI